MNENKPFKKFSIICQKCGLGNKKHETILYVDWEKRYYMITCQSCGETVVFDEYADLIDLNSKEEKHEKTEKSSN